VNKLKDVTFIFVNTKKTIFHRVVGWLINAFEHGSEFASHAAIQFDYLKGYGPVILEATGKGVLLTDYTKYDDDAAQCKITISLTDEQYTILEQKAIQIAEHKYTYSYKACIIGGIANSFSRQFAKLLAKILKADTDDQLNCSETGTELIRSVYTDFVTEWADAQITPYDLYIQMIIYSVYGELTISQITRYVSK